jgi:hypothetical protein
MNALRSNGSTGGISGHDARTGPAAETRTDGVGDRERKLSHRDWILLPFLGLLTVVFVASSTEFIARRAFPEHDSVQNCIADPRSAEAAVGRPNSSCWEKRAEMSLPVQYTFNSCGHRAGMECGPKAPGTYRIVMSGSSMTLGLDVAREQTFAALLPLELSRQTGRKVELYNEATIFGSPLRNIALHFKEIQSEDPDMFLWVLTPIDVSVPSRVSPEGAAGHVAATHLTSPGNRESNAGFAWFNKVPLFFAKLSRGPLFKLWDKTRTALVLRHLLYEREGPDRYVESYLAGNTDETALLRAELSADWQPRLHQFDIYVADVAARARAAGIPLVVVLIPNRAQAAMISTGKWPAGYDPYKLGQELRTIVTNHGGTYIDILPGFRDIPHSERDYFPVEGHADASGHAMFSELLAKELTNGSIPALKAATASQAELEKQK